MLTLMLDNLFRSPITHCTSLRCLRDSTCIYRVGERMQHFDSPKIGSVIEAVTGNSVAASILFRRCFLWLTVVSAPVIKCSRRRNRRNRNKHKAEA